MRAIGKFILINPEKEKSVKTKGGLILGESQREDIRYRRAKVVEVGCGVENLNKEDEIYYDRAAGFKIEINSKEYKVIKEFDVVVVL